MSNIGVGSEEKGTLSGLLTRCAVTQEVKEWFLDYKDIQSKRFGWSVSRSLREAKAMAPEIFDAVRDSVPRRWHRDTRPIPGRPKLLKDAELTVLSSLAINVCGKVPVAAPVVQSIFNTQLKEMGSEYTVSVSWTRKFLSDIDLNWRKFIRKSSTLISEDAAWIANVTWHKSCRLLSLSDFGWHPKNKDAVAVGDSRVQTTVTLAVPMTEGTWFSQAPFAGKTRRALPQGLVLARTCPWMRQTTPGSRWTHCYVLSSAWTVSSISTPQRQ
eukprot:2219575-Amphidinium_carterae.1